MRVRRLPPAPQAPKAHRPSRPGVPQGGEVRHARNGGRGDIFPAHPPRQYSKRSHGTPQFSAHKQPADGVVYRSLHPEPLGAEVVGDSTTCTDFVHDLTRRPCKVVTGNAAAADEDGEPVPPVLPQIYPSPPAADDAQLQPGQANRFKMRGLDVFQ